MFIFCLTLKYIFQVEEIFIANKSKHIHNHNW